MLRKNLIIILIFGFLFFTTFLIFNSEKASAGSYNGEDLALAILENSSTLVSSSYSDTDESGCSQSTVLSSLGIMQPTHGSTFALFSTGVAGYNPITLDEQNPGDER